MCRMTECRLFLTSNFYFASQNKSDLECYVATFYDNGQIFGSLSAVVCYWIVLCELGSFIMGFGAGALTTLDFVWISILNYILNVVLLCVLVPVMSCMNFDNNSVGLIIYKGCAWLFLHTDFRAVLDSSEYCEDYF